MQTIIPECPSPEIVHETARNLQRMIRSSFVMTSGTIATRKSDVACEGCRTVAELQADVE